MFLSEQPLMPNNTNIHNNFGHVDDWKIVSNNFKSNFQSFHHYSHIYHEKWRFYLLSFWIGLKCFG